MVYDINVFHTALVRLKVHANEQTYNISRVRLSHTSILARVLAWFSWRCFNTYISQQ